MREGGGAGVPDPGGGEKATSDEAAEGREGAAGRETSDADEIFYCDLCGNAMLNLHCKLICERCGYKRDCSDP